jgi:hypothetical protein
MRSSGANYRSARTYEEVVVTVVAVHHALLTPHPPKRFSGRGGVRLFPIIAAGCGNGRETKMIPETKAVELTVRKVNNSGAQARIIPNKQAAHQSARAQINNPWSTA